jgi:hypothetical protein
MFKGSHISLVERENFQNEVHHLFRTADKPSAVSFTALKENSQD